MKEFNKTGASRDGSQNDAEKASNQKLKRKLESIRFRAYLLIFNLMLAIVYFGITVAVSSIPNIGTGVRLVMQYLFLSFGGTFVVVLQNLVVCVSIGRRMRAS